MVMEFDQYLQLCDVTDNRYLAVYDSVPKPQPLIDVYREAAVGVGAQPASVPPYSSTENEPAVGVDDSAAAPTENRCVWACNFDHDDTETILTSETVSF